MQSSARIVTRTRPREHITLVLKSLHWLPVSRCIDYKILSLTNQCLHGTLVWYLLCPIQMSDFEQSLTGTACLMKMSDRCTIIDWNSLPDEDVRSLSNHWLEQLLACLMKMSDCWKFTDWNSLPDEAVRLLKIHWLERLARWRCQIIALHFF